MKAGLSGIAAPVPSGSSACGHLATSKGAYSCGSCTLSIEIERLRDDIADELNALFPDRRENLPGQVLRPPGVKTDQESTAKR